MTSWKSAPTRLDLRHLVALEVDDDMHYRCTVCGNEINTAAKAAIEIFGWANKHSRCASLNS